MNNETEVPDLLPCPFCGGEPVDPRPIAMTRCTDANCVAGQRWAYATKWNTRADLHDAQKARIAELEAELYAMTEDRNIISETSQQQFIRIAELEAKLAKAVQFTEGVIRYAGNSGDDYLAEQARATLTELKGGKDE